MNHRETLEFLNQRGNEVQTMHLGLHRTEAVMRALKEPHTRYASIHIAGTNGKGSVAAMTESILRHSGRKTGLYTSPHLVRVEERFRINGSQISPRSFARIATKIALTEEGLLKKNQLDRYLTTFEFLTCCALLCFAEEEVEIAVIEVGLGGKLDATNVIRPLVSIITRVAYDHQNYLGNSLSKIAGEKAGIIKEGAPVVSGCRDGIPMRVVRKQASKVHAPLLESFRDSRIEIREAEGRYCRFDLETPVRTYRNLKIPLAGAYQAENAALAVLAVETLESFSVKETAIRKGLSKVLWQGRLDEYRSKRKTLFDGAHNPDAAEQLGRYLAGRKEKEIHLVFGAVRDKNIRGIASRLFPLATSIHLTPLANTRSARPEDVAAMAAKYRSRMEIHSDMRRALYAAWKRCSPEGLVVVTGSLYLVGELLPIVRKFVKRSTPVEQNS